MVIARKEDIGKISWKEDATKHVNIVEVCRCLVTNTCT